MSDITNMNSVIRDEWVAALRSGEYKQCCGRLHLASEDSYCCLGVLTDVVCELFPGRFSSRVYEGGALDDTITTVCRIAGLLPTINIPKEKLELYSKALYNKAPDKIPTLSWLNDGVKLSFAEIADLIEKDVPHHESTTSVS